MEPHPPGSLAGGTNPTSRAWAWRGSLVTTLGSLALICAALPTRAQEPVPDSPTLTRLRAATASGDTAALTRFWHALAQAGTPVLEPLPNDSTNVLVSFVWRGNSRTRNVSLLLRARLGDGDDAMHRIPGTDIWYRSYVIRRDARISYAFSENGPRPGSNPTPEAQLAAFRRDTLNERRFPTAGADQPAYSVLDAGGDRAGAWTVPRAGIATGRRETFAFHSRILENDRDIAVYLPPGYEVTGSDAPYPLLVLFDGRGAMEIARAPTILDNMIGDGVIPPVVGLFVGNAEGARIRELPASEPFTDFLAEELIPTIRERYAVTVDPSQTLVGGVSFGGLAATYAAFTHPEIFGNVISLSGSFWWAPRWWTGPTESVWHARLFTDTPRLPIRFHLEVGLIEADLDLFDNIAQQVPANRHMRDVLRAKGYDVSYHEFYGGHEWLPWQAGLARALISLFGQ